MDPSSAATAIALIASATKVGAPLVERALGPAADLVGDEIKVWAERRLHNFGRIIESANGKMREDESEVLGPPPPRVLARVIGEGSYCEDPITVEYLGGVLASSRSGVSRDDRGAAVAALITRLSTYDLRTHYVIYRTARSLLVGQDVNLRLSKDQNTHGQVFLPLDMFVAAMDFTSEESVGDVVTQALPRLVQEGLIGEAWGLGPPDRLAEITSGALPPSPGIVVTITLAGLQLFCWAFGYKSDAAGTFLDPETDFETTPPMVIPPGAMKVEDMRSLGQEGT